MKTFDLIVIGTGAGARIYRPAALGGKKVAIVESGPFGGTCLNRGCIPSKMLIHSAEVARTIDSAAKFGINTKGYTVDFSSIVKRVSATVDHDAQQSEKGAHKNKNMTHFKETGFFVGSKEIQVGKETITAEKIFIAAGTRPSVPPITGLKDTPYITSDGALRLSTQPKVLTVIGGGYIAAELGYFFGALGTKIQMVVRGKRLLDREDSEIADRFTEVFSKNYGVFFEHETLEVSWKKGIFFTTVKDASGKTRVLESDQLLVATGRRPNTDLLKLDAAGIELDERKNVKTNEYLETSVAGVYALGDIAGKYMFRHSANFEGEYLYGQHYAGAKRAPINYRAMPHAVFSHPQIAGVGLTEDEAKTKGIPYQVAKRNYMETAMGVALDDHDGFIKMLIDPKTRLILGVHIIGTDASTLIHEVIPLIAFAHPIDEILETIHIHPALSELVQRCAWEFKTA